MTVPPTNIESPPGWTETTTNSSGAIQWVDDSIIVGAGTVTDRLHFDSTLTPAELEGPCPGTR